jgi:hypothetical protein
VSGVATTLAGGFCAGAEDEDAETAGGFVSGCGSEEATDAGVVSAGVEGAGVGVVDAAVVEAEVVEIGVVEARVAGVVSAGGCVSRAAGNWFARIGGAGTADAVVWAASGFREVAGCSTGPGVADCFSRGAENRWRMSAKKPDCGWRYR